MVIKRILKWTSVWLARRLRGTSEQYCCRCEMYKSATGTCGIYFIQNGQSFMMRVSSWDACIMGDLKEEVQVADMDVIEKTLEEIKVAKGEETNEDEKDTSEEGTEQTKES